MNCVCFPKNWLCLLCFVYFLDTAEGTDYVEGTGLAQRGVNAVHRVHVHGVRVHGVNENSMAANEQ